MRPDDKVAHLVRLFGSPTSLARAAGVNKAAVHRWPTPRGINVKHQRRIVAQAVDDQLPLEEVLWAVGAQTCPCCGCLIDNEIRALVGYVKAKKRSRARA